MISKVPIESVSVGDSVSVNNLINTVSGVVSYVDAESSSLKIRGMDTVFDVVYEMSSSSQFWLISSYTPRKPAITTPGVYLSQSGSVYSLDNSGRWFSGSQEITTQFDDMPRLVDPSETAYNLLIELIPFMFVDSLTKSEHTQASTAISNIAKKYKSSVPPIPEFVPKPVVSVVDPSPAPVTGSTPVIPTPEPDPTPVPVPDTSLSPGEANIGDGGVIVPDPNAPDPYVGIDS